MEYHLLFIGISFCLLFVTVYLVLIDKTTKEGLMAAMFFDSLNWLFTYIICLGFFGIDVIGYTTSGGVEVNTLADNYYLFAIFFLLQFACVGLMYLCIYKWVKKAWDIDKDVYQKQSPKSEW